MSQMYFYSVASRSVIDVVAGVIDGERVGGVGRKRESELKLRYPDLKCGSGEEAQREVEQSYIEDPSEIDADEFDEWLGAVPPIGHRCFVDSESFKMSEFTYGQVTLICCRFGKRHFKMRDRVTLSHDEIIAKVHKALASAVSMN